MPRKRSRSNKIYDNDELGKNTLAQLKEICEELNIPNIPDSRYKRDYISLIMSQQEHSMDTGMGMDQGSEAREEITHSKTRNTRSSPSSSATGGIDAESVNPEIEYAADLISPRGPQDDPKAQISGKVAKWFTPEYLDIYISHFRRNTDIGKDKRPSWLDAIRNGNRPFAGHPINLELNPTVSMPGIEYLGYFNYAGYPQFGVSDAEMRDLNSVRDKGVIHRRPRMVIMIGGASVGKSYNKPNFSKFATDLDVDEPVNLANAMIQLMPDKEDMWGSGKGINQRYIIYAVIDRLIHNKDDIILDTTGGSKIAIHYAMNQAKAAGYEIVCVAVWSKLDIAYARCNERTATTLRTMSGSGVFFTFKSAREGMFINHYAIKPRFRRKIDLFFLLDNSELPKDPETVHAAQQTDALQSIITDIEIPANTILILRNSVDSGTLHTKLIYKTSLSPAEFTNKIYGCRITLPTTIDPEADLTDDELHLLLRCSRHLIDGEKDGGRRTRKIIKIRSTRRRYKYKSNHRSNKHVKNSRRRRN
jgi:hypothetical protein